MAANSSLQQLPTLSNFEIPANSSYQAFVAAGICFPAILIFAGIRWYVKRYILKARVKDDYAYFAGMVAGLAYTSLIVALYRGGAFGKHVWDVGLEEVTAGQLRLFAAIEILYQPFIWLIKLPLFLLLLEIFGRLRWMKLWAWGGLVATGLFSVGAMWVEIQACAPLPADTRNVNEWLSVVSPLPCVLDQSPSYQMAAINLATEIFILVLPLPAIWSLQLQMRKKLGITAIFMTGLGACVCSAVELYWKVVSSKSRDFTWNAEKLLILSVVEMTLGLLIPCMPAIGVLNRRIVPQAMSRIKQFASNLYRQQRRSNPGGELPYAEISESGCLSPDQQLHSIEHRHGGIPPSDPRTLQILKTTEFTVRPSSNSEAKQHQITRLEWEKNGLIGGIRH